MKHLIIVILFLQSASSIAQHVKLDSVAYKNGYRTLRLFLPETYKTQEFPLLVMLDGQNLFDEKTSYAVEWNVDESISSFPIEKQSIVIAIDHGNELRMEELTPYKNEKYVGGKGSDFLKWIMEMALPQIIKKYDLAINPHKRAIAGSSLGGLFAHFATIKHPEYFQTAGVLSPSFWWSEECYELVKDQKSLKKQHFFFAAGTEEGDDMIPDMKKMHDLMLKKGAKVTYLEEKGAKHNEAQWRSTFLAFYHIFIHQL